MVKGEKENKFMKEAMDALQSVQVNVREAFTVLKERVRRTVRSGRPDTFRWRQLRIDYRVRDEFGLFNCRFIVSNPYTGSQVEYAIKDFMADNGAVLWGRLASRIKNTK